MNFQEGKSVQRKDIQNSNFLEEQSSTASTKIALSIITENDGIQLEVNEKWSSAGRDKVILSDQP